MTDTAPQDKRSPIFPYAIMVYVAVVLTVDALATHRVHFVISWDTFNWLTRSNFDWFKFIFWFVVPVVLSLWGMDWGYFGVKRWKKFDYAFILILGILGLIAVFAIPLIPALQNYYPSLSHLSPEQKMTALKRGLLWNLAWLPGWEFLHRYFLLRAASERWPKYGWLLVPLSETLYHLQKHWTEMLLMGIASLVLTGWALRRRNALLPFLAHAIVEVGLILFLVFV